MAIEGNTVAKGVAGAGVYGIGALIGGKGRRVTGGLTALGVTAGLYYFMINNQTSPITGAISVPLFIVGAPLGVAGMAVADGLNYVLGDEIVTKSRFH